MRESSDLRRFDVSGLDLLMCMGATTAHKHVPLRASMKQPAPLQRPRKPADCFAAYARRTHLTLSLTEIVFLRFVFALVLGEYSSQQDINLYVAPYARRQDFADLAKRLERLIQTSPSQVS